METEEEPFQPFPTPDKSEQLPIERRPYGFVQRASYVQADRHHEEVAELESLLGAPDDLVSSSLISPSLSSADQGLRSMSFVLVGDQNAGKSSFLHCFCHRQCPGFLRLSSALPFLSASFLNARFLAPHLPPLDEAPFLDTDVARASVLISRDDYNFFLEENDLLTSSLLLESESPFVLFHFIEIGGDHLDRLSTYSSATAATSSSSSPNWLGGCPEAILKQTEALLTGSRKCMYFLNASRLFEGRSPHGLNGAHLEGLLRRLAFLDAVLPCGHELLVNLSRLDQLSLPPSLLPSAFQSALSFAVAFGPPFSLFLSPTSSTPVSTTSTLPADWLEPFLHSLFKGLRIRLAAVTRFRHVAADGGIRHEEVLGTLALLLREGACCQVPQPAEARAARVLVDAFYDLCGSEQAAFEGPSLAEDRSRASLDASWMSSHELQAFLLRSSHAYPELPPLLPLQAFSSLSRRLIHLGLAIPHARNHHTSLHLRFVSSSASDSTTLCNRGPTNPDVFMIRFPQLEASLVALVRYFIVHDLPDELWLSGPPADLSSAPDLQQDLAAAGSALLQRLEARWRSLLAAVEASRPSASLHGHDWLWLLEEWAVFASLQRGPNPPSSPSRLPLVLPFCPRCCLGLSSLLSSSPGDSEESFLDVIIPTIPLDSHCCCHQSIDCLDDPQSSMRTN